MTAALGCFLALLLGVWCGREIVQHLDADWQRTWNEIDAQRKDWR